MNRDDIIRMAREAAETTGTLTPSEWNEPLLERFASLVAAAEREVCADIAENWRCNGMPRYGVGEAIRARGQE